MSYHLPNIRHKKTITPEDFIWRVNLYAAWIHLLNAMIQSVAGQWDRFAKAAKELPGAWRIRSDVSKVSGAIRAASPHLARYLDRLDSVDLAEWRNVKDAMSVHDKENRDKLWEFMDKFDNEFVSDDAADVFALNYIYTLNIDDDENKTGDQR